ncbi:hypothetical protein BHM03_00021635 [Ensete ventricosum]|nr:hypothetical protein BHM03_00021635 [Ensete ventricosum]
MSLRHGCGKTWSQRDYWRKNHQNVEKLVGDVGAAVVARGGGGRKGQAMAVRRCSGGSKEVQRW